MINFWLLLKLLKYNNIIKKIINISFLYLKITTTFIAL